MYKALRHARYNTAAIIVVAVALAVGLGVGLGVQVAAAKRDIGALQRSLVSTRVMLDESIMEVAMNATGGVEVEQQVLQTGTYSFTLISFTMGGTTTTGNTYTLKQYAIGPLRFSVLVLDPTTPVTTPASGGGFNVAFDTFNPPLPVFAGYSILPISASNIARFNLPCLVSDPCSLNSGSPDFYEGSLFFVDETTAQGQFSYNGGATNYGFAFTWTEPLKLILPDA